MAYAIIDNSIVQNIANAIRAKLGIQTTMKPDEMPGKIASIPEIQGNAAVTNVLADKTFSSVTAGQGVTGTMPNRGAITKTLAPGETYTVPEGYHNGNGTVTTGGATQEKTATPDVTPVEVTPDEGYSLTKVTVAPIPNQRTVTDETIGVPKTYQAGWYPNQWTVTPEETEPMLQVKTVDPATTDQTVTADDGYDGLREVRVNAYTLTTKSITENGTYTASSDGANGYSSVTINVPTGTAYPVRIYVATPPTKTEYVVGDSLDLTGMIIKAVWSDGSETDITNSTTKVPADGALLSLTDANVLISYVWNGASSLYTTTQSITVESTASKAYGVLFERDPSTYEITSTRTDRAEDFEDPRPQYSDGSGGWTTGSSPFDNIAPWSGMTKSNRVGGSMVAIPKFYYKWTITDSTMQLQIVPAENAAYALANGFQVSPAHMDRGDGVGERDIVYIGRYKCSSNISSETDSYPLTDYDSEIEEYTKRYTLRRRIHDKNSNLYLSDYAIRLTIQMLYLVEFASWNAQEKIGGGEGVRGGSAIFKTGYTDAMTYHTGSIATSIGETAYGGEQYRWIEGLWDNCLEYIDGITFYDNNIYAFINPDDYSDNHNDGVLVGAQPTNAMMMIRDYQFSNANNFGWFMFPVSKSVQNTRCYPNDVYMYYSESANQDCVLTAGGYYSTSEGYAALAGTNAGLFALDTRVDANSTASNTGGRIMELPNNVQIVSWENGTDAEIAAMLQAHYNGEIDIHDYWHVGDTRTIHLSAMAATGVGESHVEQDVEMVIVHDEGYDLVTPINGITKAAFIIQQKDCLEEKGYMNSSSLNTGSWNSSLRRAWCNNVYYNALPSTIRSIFKQVNVLTAKEYDASENINSQDYIFLPAAREVFVSGMEDTYASSNVTEWNALSVWEYYKTLTSRRGAKKMGMSGNLCDWWERSPGRSGAYYFCYVRSGSGNDASTRVNNTNGLAPAGAI